MISHKRKSVCASCTKCTGGKGNEAAREGGGKTNETIACTKKKQRHGVTWNFTADSASLLAKSTQTGLERGDPLGGIEVSRLVGLKAIN